MRLAILVCAVFVAHGSAGTPDQQTTTEAARTVERWADAVEHHSPGAHDAAVDVVLAMTPAVRQSLTGPMQVFLDVLGEPTPQLVRENVNPGSANINGKELPPNEIDRMKSVARDEARRMGKRVFLARAATLHADAAIAAGHASATRDRSPDAGRVAGQGGTSSWLPSEGRLVLASDGEIVGSIEANWNWPFARRLLDLDGLKPGNDPFVATWYHATTAHLLANGLYAEARTHLDRAAALLRGDSRILFDRGCWFEAMGLPFSQALVSEEARLAARLASQTSADVLHPEFGPKPSPIPLQGSAFGNIPSMADANAEAERLFRRALISDPSLVEARVRLARLLDVRGRHQEAGTELAGVFDGSTRGTADPVVLFYAHLFAARTERVLGRLDAAVRHANAALELYPNAQSALSARSQLAILASDAAGGIAPINRLAQLPSDVTLRSDPWWDYHLGPGRDADVYLKAMWTKVPH